MHDEARRWRCARRSVLRGVLCTAFIAAGAVCRVGAQEPPPRIGPFVFDFHGVMASFSNDPQLASSRVLNQAELPGAGLGLSGALQFYLPKILSFTIGLGGEAIIARSS